MKLVSTGAKIFRRTDTNRAAVTLRICQALYAPILSY
jgi:hypothetical protein